MDSASERDLNLVGRIYDSAFQPSLWPDTLIELADALGGSQVCFVDHDPRTTSLTLLAPRHRPEYIKSMREDWLGQLSGNLIGERLLVAPARQPFHLCNLISPDEFTPTPFYHEWWRPQRFGLAALGIKWTLENGRWGFCCVHQAAGQDDFNSRQAGLFGAAARHLVRAQELNVRLLRAGVAGAMTHAGLNRLDVGVIITDAAAKIIFANDMAAGLLQTRDGILVKGSAVVAADARAAALLAGSIASCASRRGHRGSGGELRLPRGSRPPLHALVTSFPDSAAPFDLSWLGLRDRAAMLVVSDPNRQRQLRKERLKHCFGLTAAEAELALEVTTGDGREAAARRLGITLGTARTHLQRIFEKTGVHRQAELVRLIAEIDGP